MAKVVIIYDTKTGNTELMAHAVAEGAKSVKDTVVSTLRLGTKWPISTLKDANAIIIGSPTRYGNITTELSTFFQTLAYLQSEKHVVLEGKKSAAFGSYGWDGGWNTQRIEEEMIKLGMEIVASAVSAVDQGGIMETRISKDDMDKCRRLGETVAKAVAK
jgi:flavorubredoxin